MATFGFHTDCDCCVHDTELKTEQRSSMQEQREKLQELAQKQPAMYRPHVAIDLGVDPYVLLLIQGRFFQVPYYLSLDGDDKPVLKVEYRLRANFICDYKGRVLKSAPKVSDKVQELYNRIGREKFLSLVTDLRDVEPTQAAKMLREHLSRIDDYEFFKTYFSLPETSQVTTESNNPRLQTCVDCGILHTHLTKGYTVSLCKNCQDNRIGLEMDE